MDNASLSPPRGRSRFERSRLSLPQSAGPVYRGHPRSHSRRLGRGGAALRSPILRRIRPDVRRPAAFQSLIPTIPCKATRCYAEQPASANASKNGFPREEFKLIHDVTGATFERLVMQTQGPVAVEFMTYGCERCRSIEPVLQQAATMLHAKARIFRVNVAMEEHLAADYAIRRTPTLVMLLEAREVGRVEEPHPTLSNVILAVSRPFATRSLGRPSVPPLPISDFDGASLTRPQNPNRGRPPSSEEDGLRVAGDSRVSVMGRFARRG